MTRRQFISFAAAAAVPTRSRTPILVPVHQVLDRGVHWKPRQTANFWWHIWPEAVRDFRRIGISFQTSLSVGSVGRPPGREPVVEGLERGALNLVITNRIPMEWDQGRTLSGVTTLYRGYHLCMVALDHAHGHQVPLLSVNTCTHELLHALMLDIFEDRPAGVAGMAREFRIDWYATRLWLFGDGEEIRGNAQKYLRRLSEGAGR